MTTAVGTDDSALYVFGIVATDQVATVRTMVGVDLVPAGSIAAVVGAVTTDRPLGLASDMRRHDRVVSDLVAAGVTVLPMRFGAVVGEADDLVQDFLVPKQAALERAVRALAGRVQFTVRVDYVREAVLAAVLRSDDRVAAARAAATDHAGRVRLGELVVNAIERRRPADAQRIRGELEPETERITEQLSGDPDRVADFACLVPRDRAAQFAEAADAVTRRFADAVTMRVLGPLAPYDFVPEL